MINAREAEQRLVEGNKSYLNSCSSVGNISPELRRQTAQEGQHPYAIVVCCSDSRVIPEALFSAGIGELFVIRVAGNVLDNHQLGSIEYAAEHLGTKLIVVLGHTGCGAVNAAIKREKGRYIDYILQDVSYAIGDEKDEFKAACLNVKYAVEKVRHEFKIHPIEHDEGLKVKGAICHIETGLLEFLED